MARSRSHLERTTTDARRLSPGLSVFVLLALLSASPGGGVFEVAPASGRVATGTFVMPVVVAFREAEGRASWSEERGERAHDVRGPQRFAVSAPLREALLALPPPARV